MSAHTQATREREGIRNGIRTGAVACAAAFTLVAAIPSLAHHSFAAEFDSTKEIKASGEVAVLEWQNPHGWIHVSALEICERPGRQGRGGGSGDEPRPEWSCRTPTADEGADWAFELASPNGLMRQGWTRNSLKPGDRVTVEGTRARDGSNHANARVVTTGEGKRLFAGSSENAGQ